MNRKESAVSGLAVATLLASGLSFADGNLAPDQSASASIMPGISDVGIWYATWYSKLPAVNPTWITNFGGSSLNQFVADANGDEMDDAITFDSGGVWNVALSNGTGFSSPTSWISGHGAGATSQFAEDVTGDGKADAIVFFNSDVNGDGQAGDWYVAISNGSSFPGFSLWKSGFGQNATKHFIGDVNGGGLKDVVAFFANDTGGKWAVSLSSGTAFGALSTWATGLGGGSSNQFLGDTNGDGKSDAIYWGSSSGTWQRALSSGTAFGSAALWTDGHGAGSSTQLVSDGNGDGYVEPYAHFNADVGLPSGDGLPGDLIGREWDRSRVAISGSVLFNTGFGYNSTKILQGNVTGDRYDWKAGIAFFAGVGGGSWAVQRHRAADTVATNTWLGFGTKPEIKYRPLTLGSYQTYDSGDSAVIDEHLATISEAKIDFMLLDETNELNNVSGAILNRANDVALRVSARNDNPSNRHLSYAFAIGGIQYSGQPLTIEQEAAQVWAEFANDTTIGGSDYYSLDGKPLLVVYATAALQTAWLNYTGDKTSSNRFTVRFATGAADAVAGAYGWQLPPSGTIDDDEVMLAMPGWDNHYGNIPPVSRDKGLFYVQKNWTTILARPTQPKVVILNSFNEFAEDTGMQTTDTSALTTSEKWYNTDGALDNSMYWNMTRDFVNQLKNPSLSHRASTGFSSTQSANGWHYEEWAYVGGTRTVNVMTWDAPAERWKGTNTWSLVSNNWQHPEVNAESARVYVATSAGNVTVSGLVALQGAGGDGVAVRILKNDVQVWPASGGGKVLTDLSPRHYLFDLTVISGDKIQFVVNAISSSTSDTTIWDPTITYN